MPKHPHLEALLDRISIQNFGVSRKDAICPFCKSTAVGPNDFRDDLSRKEFTLSRLCQQCQDDTFGGPK